MTNKPQRNWSVINLITSRAGKRRKVILSIFFFAFCFFNIPSSFLRQTTNMPTFRSKRVYQVCKFYSIFFFRLTMKGKIDMHRNTNDDSGCMRRQRSFTPEHFWCLMTSDDTSNKKRKATTQLKLFSPNVWQITTEFWLYKASYIHFRC